MFGLESRQPACDLDSVNPSHRPCWRKALANMSVECELVCGLQMKSGACSASGRFRMMVALDSSQFWKVVDFGWLSILNSRPFCI
jgi:hypothetical protein